MLKDHDVQETLPLTSRKKTTRSRFINLPVLLLTACCASQLIFVLHENGYIPRFSSWARHRVACSFPLPNILAHHPLQTGDRTLDHASKSLHRYLSNRVSQPDIDSLAIAVVTPAGIIFEGGYGILKANESQTSVQQFPVGRNSIYRVASITKMFTVLETLILRGRGMVDWDEPVEKYIPEFSPPSHGWSEHGYQHLAHSGRVKPRITLRQLASHMSGLGRDFPPSDIGEWPTSTDLNAKISPAFPSRTFESVIKAVNKYPLANLPYLYPIYSNTGFDLLGLVNVAANKLANQSEGQPQTHKELVQKHIFDPLGLNSSFYRVPAEPALRDHIAVPSQDSEWADYVLGDVDDPAGGQYSSLKDLAVVMQTFLSPTAEGGRVQDLMREWLRPLHIWQNGLESVGAPWEIKFHGRDRVPLYSKGGSLPGYHTQFTLNPRYSYGVIALLTGTFTNSASIVSQAIDRFQPVFEKAVKRGVRNAYVGRWTNGNDIAVIKLTNGGLYIKKLFIRGMDVLSLIQQSEHKPDPVALWDTGRPGEFRLAFGRKELNHLPNAGCMPYWISIDPGASSRDAPIDLLYWEDGVLVYPSAGVRFSRPRK